MSYIFCTAYSADGSFKVIFSRLITSAEEERAGFSAID